MDEIISAVATEALTVNPDILCLDADTDVSIAGSRTLIHAEALIVTLTNWAIDPAKRRPGIGYRSRVRALRLILDRSSAKCLFRVLTSFEAYDATAVLVGRGPNSTVEAQKLTKFGAEITDWAPPTDHEVSEGYLAAINVLVPIGFSRRRG